MRGIPELPAALSTAVALALTLGSITLSGQAFAATEGGRSVTQSATSQTTASQTTASQTTASQTTASQTTASQATSSQSRTPVTGLAPRAIADGKTHTFTYDKYSFSVDGQRINVWSAEFHYWRLPSPSLWRDVLQKIKANGYNTVSIYFDWDYHSPKSGVYDFTGVRDVDQLLDIAAETGLYVIARPGPYINAETDSGGFPGWLTTIKGHERSQDADYVAAADQWWNQITKILARHQFVDGNGSVVLLQLENEWYNDLATFQHLTALARANGLTVPTTHNDGGINGNGQQGDGGPDLYTFDNYPLGFDCQHPDVWPNGPKDISTARQYSPTGPLFVGEFQGGAFDYWGGKGYEACRQLTGTAFQRVFYESNLAYGATAQNFYMTYGGTSWGWLPAPSNVYTSYDYGAAITEARQLTDKSAGMKQLGFLLNTVKPLAETDDAPNLTTSNPAVQVQARTNPDTGTRMLVARQVDATSTADVSTTFALSTADGSYPVVPQSGALRLNGRDSKLLVADWDITGKQHLVYSTSEVFADGQINGRDGLWLVGRAGQDGETVLRYPAKPTVTVNSGAATATWDADKGDLRLNYVHTGTTQVTLSGGGLPDLVLRFGDDASVARLWKQDTAAGPVLESGPELVRTAAVDDGVLALTGDTDRAVTATIWAPSTVTSIRWNGSRTKAVKLADGTWSVPLGGPKDQPLPALTGWRSQDESTQQASPAYDDSAWALANHQTTNNPAPPANDQTVLYADDYGFHHGDVWYRGHFTAAGTETSIDLSAGTGNAGLWSVWLNGTFLGSSTGSSKSFAVPAGSLVTGKDNVVAVLVRNMGHDETYGNGAYKNPRGLTSASISGSSAQFSWRIQGSRGGEDIPDTARGALNNGGLLGERSGWTLPGYSTKNWTPATLPASQPAGVTWYRTTFDYQPISGQDSSIALRITDDAARQYRSLIFVNGWNLGQYINNIGPQTDFVLPNGILHSGINTISIPSWAADDTGGLGKVSLVDLGTVNGGVAVKNVQAPDYKSATYRDPANLGHVTVTAPGSVKPGATYTVSAAFTAVKAAATGTVLHLSTTDGWTVAGDADVSIGSVRTAATATATWQVTAPNDAAAGLGVATVTATATQNHRTTTVSGSAGSLIPLPPPTGTHWASELPFQSTNGWGPVERDTSNGEAGAGDGHPITIGGTVFAHGLGINANSDVKVFLGGNCTRFTATVGVDDEVGDLGSVTFSVVGDGKVLTTTNTLYGTDPAGVPLDVDLTGVQNVELVVDSTPDGNGSDHADWGDAKFVCNP